MNDVLYLRNITCVLLTNEATAYHRCIYSVSQSFFMADQQPTSGLDGNSVDISSG